MKNNINYWIIASGENARLWNLFYKKGIIGIGWDKLGDLKKCKDKKEIQKKLRDIYKYETSAANSVLACFEFAHTIKPGDFLFVKKGSDTIIGFGEVLSDYIFDETRKEYKHIRKMKWIKKGEWKLKDEKLVLKTLTNITSYAGYSSKLKMVIGNKQERTKEIIHLYLEYVKKVGIKYHINDEGYKFDFVNHFQNNFKFNAKNFSAMIDEALINNNLTVGSYFYPKKMLLYFIEKDKVRVKKAFMDLFDKSKDVESRINDFKKVFDDMMTKDNKKTGKNDHTFISLRFISLLLASKFPNEFYFVKSTEFKRSMKYLDNNFKIARGMSVGEKYNIFARLADKIRGEIKKVPEMKDIRNAFIDDKKREKYKMMIKDDNYCWTTQDLIFRMGNMLKEEKALQVKIEKGEKELEKKEVKVARKIELKADVVNFKELLRKTNFEDNKLSDFHSLGDPKREKIYNIVSECHDQKWMVPHFQRYFDWKKEDIRDFWESIANNYYVGSFLMLATGDDLKLGVQAIEGVKGDDREPKPDMIILDGQQRATSIYYAVKAPNGVELKGNKNLRFYYYINFYKLFINEGNDNLVEFYQGEIIESETIEGMLFPLYKLENYRKWVDKLQDYLLDEFPGANDTRRIVKLIRIISDKLNYIWQGFEIPYVALPKSVELAQVSDIFENINTKGKPLDVFDLLIARLYKYSIELREMWDKEGNENATLAKYPNIKRYYTDGKNNKIPIYIMQSLSLLYEKNSSAKRSDILNIYSNIYEGERRDFREDWMDVSKFLNDAINKLENLKDNGFGVKDEYSLPFSPMIPVLTALIKVVSEKEEKAKCNRKIKQWYWSAVFSNAYSQGADSKMTSDFKEMKKWFKNDNDIPKVVLRMRKELSLGYTDFREIQSWSSAKYKGIMSLLAIEGAKDFDTSETLENAKDNDKDHIFPKSLELNNINSVLNMTWMSEETNRKIKQAKKPPVYINEFVSDKYNNNEDEFYKVLKTHFISWKGYKMLIENKFDEFIAEREKSIVNKIKKLVGYDFTVGDKIQESPNKVLTDIENEIRNFIDKVLRKNMGNDYWPEAIPQHIDVKVNLRINVDQTNAPYMEAISDSHEKLTYLDVTEYSDIIIKNWVYFEKYFSNKENTVNHFKHLSDFRNPIKHARERQDVIDKLGEAAILFLNGIIAMDLD